jgi:hypothetical protein
LREDEMRSDKVIVTGIDIIDEDPWEGGRITEQLPAIELQDLYDDGIEPDEDFEIVIDAQSLLRDRAA